MRLAAMHFFQSLKAHARTDTAQRWAHAWWPWMALSLLAHIWLVLHSPPWTPVPTPLSLDPETVLRFTQHIAAPTHTDAPGAPAANPDAVTATAPFPALAPAGGVRATAPAQAVASAQSAPPIGPDTAALQPAPNALSTAAAETTEPRAATNANANTSDTGQPTAPPKAPSTLLAAAGFKLPASIRLNYDLNGLARGFGYSAKAEMLWQHDGQSYNARLEVSHFLLGSRVQTSQGQLSPDGLQPRRFGDKVRSEQAAHFQRDKGVVSYSANTPDSPLLAGMQDNLSVFMQLAGWLAASPAKGLVGTSISLPTTSARSSDNWTFEVAAAESLNLPAGTFDALKLTKNEQRQYDQRVELWMAPALDHMPVRIRITQSNGDQVDMLLKSKDAAPPLP